MDTGQMGLTDPINAAYQQLVNDSLCETLTQSVYAV